MSGYHGLGPEVAAVDWSAPIEAVNGTGRVWKAETVLWDVPQGFDRWVMLTEAMQKLPRMNDGSTGSAWRIRNVPQPAAEASTSPSGGQVGPEVVERMIALVRRASDTFADEHHHGVWAEIALEADRIVALLPEPVDADEAEATALSRQWGGVDQPAMLAAIKRGRALAAGDR